MFMLNQNHVCFFTVYVDFVYINFAAIAVDPPPLASKDDHENNW